MQKSVLALLVLCLLVALSPSALAKDTSTLLFKSPYRTGIITSADGRGGGSCYATIRALKDARGNATRFYNPMECEMKPWEHISNYVSLSYPLDSPTINMTGIHEAHHVKIKNGRIILF